MYSFKTSGIVIKRMNFGEADRILTILTERLGKIKAIAKGVRKIKSKMAGSLEPYMLIDFELHEGKTFYIITGASISARYKNIHSDIKKTAKVYFVGELIDKFLEENQKANNVFEISLQILQAIEDYERSLQIVAYQLKIIEAAGFKPELNYCLHCKKKLIAGNNFWDHIEGGVICQICQQKFFHGEKISDEAIKALRFIEQNDFKNIGKLKLDKNIEREIDKILLEYIKNLLEKDLKSRKFLNQVD